MKWKKRQLQLEEALDEASTQSQTKDKCTVTIDSSGSQNSQNDKTHNGDVMIDKYSQKEWGIDGLCERWRKRREAYEQAVEEHQLQHEAIEIEKREEIINTIAKRAKASF